MTIPRNPADITPAWLGSVLGVAHAGEFRGQAASPRLPLRDRVALAYRSEVELYSAVTDNVAIPVPGCFHSEISSDGADLVLLLADLAPAVRGDPIAGRSPAEAALAVRALAGRRDVPDHAAPRVSSDS